MRPFQYSSHPPMQSAHAPRAPGDTQDWWTPRVTASILSTVIVSVGTFSIFWMLAMVSALLMLGAR